MMRMRRMMRILIMIMNSKRMRMKRILSKLITRMIMITRMRRMMSRGASNLPIGIIDDNVLMNK